MVGSCFDFTVGAALTACRARRGAGLYARLARPTGTHATLGGRFSRVVDNPGTLSPTLTEKLIEAAMCPQSSSCTVGAENSSAATELSQDRISRMMRRMRPRAVVI